MLCSFFRYNETTSIVKGIRGLIEIAMNNRIIEGVTLHMDEIIERWQVSMKDEKEERFFHFMPTHLIEKTSREFAELMMSNIADSDTVNPEKLNDFTEKVVRFGWSIKFVNKAIDNFWQITMGLLDEKQVIEGSNVQFVMNVFIKWIAPLRESIIQAYAFEWERTISLQKIALQELSASLIPIFDKISVMPLVGTIDTERAKLIMENLLEGVVKQRAEVVLLDITGVPVVDTMVAHHIIQAADAVRLVGAKCMLVGIRPEIAQTIVTLGINLKDFTTTSTLQRGMQEALRLTSRTIVEVERL